LTCFCQLKCLLPNLSCFVGLVPILALELVDLRFSFTATGESLPPELVLYISDLCPRARQSAESIAELADETMLSGSAEPSHIAPQVRKPAVITYGRRENRFIGRRNPVDDDAVPVPSRADTIISNAADRVDRREKHAKEEEAECQVNDSNQEVAYVSRPKPTKSHISAGAVRDGDARVDASGGWISLEGGSTPSRYL
jgi:hypothetical protein